MSDVGLFGFCPYPYFSYPGRVSSPKFSGGVYLMIGVLVGGEGGVKYVHGFWL
jgi:hypothetical protein